MSKPTEINIRELIRTNLQTIQAMILSIIRLTFNKLDLCLLVTNLETLFATS